MEPTVTLDLKTYDNTRKEMEKYYKVIKIIKDIIPYIKTTEPYRLFDNTYGGGDQYIELSESRMSKLLLKIIEICNEVKVC